jgi:4-diphosphocytidyl-2-C-methyl-D-erythritol kinase
MALLTKAHAKLNISLRVLGRRADGYHELCSLVAFATLADTLVFEPAETLSLTVDGPTAGDAGRLDDNLVLKAARTLASSVAGLRTGHFRLTKRIPVGAGLGGGSADAAAALRLLAAHNQLLVDDARIVAAAAATGADVPVCLPGLARMMAGIGDRLGPPLALPPRVAVLVNSRVMAETRVVFAALGLAPGQQVADAPTNLSAGLQMADGVNDLTGPAIRCYPAIGEVLELLTGLAPGAPVRMSGSGSTCFALFNTCASANDVAAAVRHARPHWWVKVSAILAEAPAVAVLSGDDV